MNMDANEFCDPLGLRQRTLSNASQQSQQSSKQNFPLMTSDSGLYTCSSNTSDCSLQLESDTDSSHKISKTKGYKEERLQFALQDVRKLRSELERLTKSEQWYKQELKQQKSTRLVDLERIYSQEKKCMQENQRLQKECVRLYEKCNELEKELEKHNQDFHEKCTQNIDEDEECLEENLLVFEKEQHLAVIKDQQQLISVLRKQKRSLLHDLKGLTVEKDEKVNDLQRLLADLEFENKLITKKCTQYAKERIYLENTLKQTESNISLVQEEKMNLQKSIVDLKEQLAIKLQLLKIKESEIDKIQQHYTKKIQHEQDLDQVHELSIKYQEEINIKTLEIINLKERLQEMQDEVEEMKSLQQQNDLQQKQIDQLNFVIEKYRLEIEELKALDVHKNNHMQELHIAMDQLVKDKDIAYKTTAEQKKELQVLKKALASTQQQYEQVQELYKNTQFQLELLEVEKGKDKFKHDSDRKEIERLRKKLKEYLEETTKLSDKIHLLEKQVFRVLDENFKLKKDTDQMIKIINNFKQDVNESNETHKVIQELQQQKDQDGTTTNRLDDDSNQRQSFTQMDSGIILDDQDFLELQIECQKLQAKLDSIKERQVCIGNHISEKYQENEEYFGSYNIFNDINGLRHIDIETENEEKQKLCNENSEKFETDIDFVKLSLQGCQLHENLKKLNETLEEKQDLLSSLHIKQASNEVIEKLVKENEILKKKLNAIETEALTLQMKEELNKRSLQYTKMEENLLNHEKTVKSIQTNLLENDSKLYKMERKLEKLEEHDPKLAELLQNENHKLKEELCQEQVNRTELSRKLEQECDKINDLKQSLQELKMQKINTKNRAIQCVLKENLGEENIEIIELKKQILQLQQDQHNFLQQEALKKEERLQFLHQMMNLQNNKMQNMQQHQKDWEDILATLNNANALEEKTRKELELKRMELEELNQVFAEQNEEFRKLEEFTSLLEIKRQNEKEQLKLTFQHEINVIRQRLQDCQKEIEQQKLVNQVLEKQNNRYKQDINTDFASEIAAYKREIRELKSRVKRIIEEKEDLLEHVNQLENQTKDIKEKKREAILMPDFSLVKLMDTSIQSSAENLQALNQNISEDHLRILTKVLEAEYQRKMLRYDEHIHSLLSNMKSLKNSLKANEEKTALLREEQIKAQEEINELQSTKRGLEEMRLKYEQSQITIKKLKDTLALERKKYERSDFEKSSQNGTVYEVSNLIDDYKKLIQQSAIATKRPSTSAILDLIQRSNQCVPNLHKFETNLEGLRSDLQNFLVSYSHKMPASSLIATASLSVPPSLMDELRAASEGF